MGVQSEKNLRRIRQKSLLLLLALFLVVGMAQPVPASGKRSRKTIRVLLVGNSYSYKNDLAGILQKIGKSCNARLTVKTIAKAGVSLSAYTNENGALGKKFRKKLAKGKWDYVILQDNRYRPLTDANGMEKDIGKLCRLIRNAGAQPMLYMTWAPQEWHTDYLDYSLLVSDREEYQETVTAACEAIAKKTGAQLIPAGLAVMQAEERFPDLEFEESDGYHPNKRGSYVVACTIYSALTAKSAYGSSTYTAGIAKETAAQLQCIAWENVSSYSRRNNKWKKHG